MAPPAADPRFHLLRSALAAGNASLVERPHTNTDRLEAAVSIVIRARDHLDFLLIKRATHERDPWSGQMALPGGRWEPKDTGLLNTARRETLEETGVNLEVHGAPLGRLDDVAPASPRLPKMRIAPFVFGVPADTEATVASQELESVHWVPLDVLRAPETAAEIKIDFPEVSRSYPSYSIVGEHVWGLTHRILRQFLELYPDSELATLRRG